MLAGYGVDREYPKWHLKLVRTKKPKYKKTNIYKVIKLAVDCGDEFLGYIKWEGAYRQYIFLPNNNTIWSRGCLEIINKFLKDKNDRYRKKLKKRRVNQDGHRN